MCVGGMRSGTCGRFWLLGLLLWAGYGLLALWFPLVPHYTQAPLRDVRAFTPSLVGGLAYGLLICALFGLTWLAYRQARRCAPGPGTLAATAVLLALPLLFTFPINATDLYRYVIRGRISSAHAANPYAAPPSAFPADPLLPLAGEWAVETSPYGPLWELLAGGVTAVTGENLLAGLLAFKLLALAAHVGTAVLIGSALAEKHKGREQIPRAALTLLWAWNPALLLTFVVNGHNDALLIFWLVLGYLLLQRGAWLPGLLALALAPLIKPIGLLALPLFFLDAWRRLPQWRARLRALLPGLAGGALLVWLAFLPFGAPLELAQRLLREATDGAGFAPAALAVLLAVRLGAPTNAALQWAGGVGVAGLGLFALWLLWRTVNGRSPTRGAAEIFAAYLAQALNFRIWYSVWLFPWLLLDQRGERLDRPLLAGFWFLLTAQLSVLIYGHVRVFALGGDVLLAHLVGAPFTFGLPLVLARIRRE
jgi:hypothetical protein